MTTLPSQTEEVLEQIVAGAKHSAYPQYSPTGTDWLPVAPSHWQTKRLRYAVDEPKKSEARTLSEDTLVSFVPMESVGEYGCLETETMRPMSEVLNGYTYFRDGDVVIAKITPCFENGKGALAEGLENGIGFGTTELHVIRPTAQVDGRYLLYLTLGEDFRQLGAAEMYGAGGQKRVPDSFIRELRHPLPPLDEQRSIAAFLDRETARIDELIAKKQRLIELLAEKRTALSSHAVTKGLNPDAPMQESGIDWVGQVPSHWTILPLKFVAMLQTGLTLGKKYDDAHSLVSRPYLRVANVQDGYLNLEHITHVDLPSSNARRYELKQGDMLMTEGGDFDKLGRGYVWDGQIEECLHQNHIFAVRPDVRRLAPHFLAFMTSSLHGKAYFTSTSNQTTNLASTNSTKLNNFPVLLPPLAEQETILTHISQISKNHDKLMQAMQKGVATSHEYRSALISAAVTGKIDVRREA